MERFRKRDSNPPVLTIDEDSERDAQRGRRAAAERILRPAAQQPGVIARPPAGSDGIPRAARPTIRSPSSARLAPPSREQRAQTRRLVDGTASGAGSRRHRRQTATQPAFGARRPCTRPRAAPPRSLRTRGAFQSGSTRRSRVEQTRRRDQSRRETRLGGRDTAFEERLRGEWPARRSRRRRPPARHSSAARSASSREARARARGRARRPATPDRARAARSAREGWASR